MEAHSLTLTSGEIRQATGGLKQPRRQLERLRRMGFWLAYLGTDGQVVLPRAHFEAVCAGALPGGAPVRDTAARPQLRPVRRAA